MYYSIAIQAGTRETGSRFPQVSTLIQQEREHRLHSSEHPNFIPKLIFELEKGAKVTDVLSQAAISAIGLLVSERFKALLEKFDLMNHGFYPATISTPKGELTYYWLHLVDSSLMDDIDYANSTFYYTRSTFKKDEIKIASHKDYLDKKKENGILWGAEATDIKLLSSFNRLLDLFVIMPFNYNIIITERLANEIKVNKITGIDILEASYIN